MRKVVWSAIARLAVVGAAIGSASCGELTRQGQASSYLVVERLEAASGATPDEFGGTLASDVLTVVDDVPTVFNDVGRVTFRLAMKDPGPTASPNVPTPNNWITVNRYRVTFTRADGRNTPGVDVPHPFDSAVTVTVADTASVGFTLVRLTAKLEAPLRALRDPSRVFIATIAEVTFYGHDQTGRAVSASGKILVEFGDWGDPQ